MRRKTLKRLSNSMFDIAHAYQTTAARVRWVCVLSVVSVLLSSCSVVSKLSGKEAAAAKQANEIQELQLKAMRFADEYVGGIVEPIQRFQEASATAEDRLRAQTWQLSQATAAYTIASGPNPITNVLDLVVLASLSRMVMEDAWVEEQFSKRAEPLRDAHRRLEQVAWQLALNVLNTEQSAQLKQVIDDWRVRNPNIRAVSYIHFRDFAKSIGRPTPGESSSRSGLFQLLGLDPLGSLDPAVREIAQTRQLAERTIYYLQRVPNLLDMQVELTTLQLVVMPESKRVLNDVDDIGEAAASTARLADALPSILAREREATINQFMNAVNAQADQMRGLVVEMRTALEAGKGTSDSVNETIRSLDKLLAQFNQPTPPGTPAKPPGRPFDITEYTAMAAEVSRTMNQLQQLFDSIDSGAPGLSQAAGHAAAELQSVVDHILWRVFAIGLLLLAAGLITALAYRSIKQRWLN